MSEWYYVDAQNAQAGPTTLDGLKAAAASGAVTSETLCWNASMSGWVAMKDVAETKAIFAPAPVPAARGPAPTPAGRGPAPTPAGRGPAPTPMKGQGGDPCRGALEVRVACC
jgi:hypothetical protein